MFSDTWRMWRTWFREDFRKGSQVIRVVSVQRALGPLTFTLERGSGDTKFHSHGTPRGLEICPFVLEGSERMLASQSALPRARLDGRATISLSPTEIVGRMITLSFRPN